MAVAGKEETREYQERVARTVLRFLRSRAKLDELIKDNPQVPFDDVNAFVEGDLFYLKEDCHALFRGPEGPGEEEHLTAGALFDLLVGSLFHTMMKIKENTYQIERYGPRYAALRKAMRGPDAPEHGADFLRVGERAMQRARRAVQQDFKHAGELFREAAEVLHHVLRENYDNPLLVRTLLGNQADVEAVYGKRTLDDLLSEMYGGRLAEALLVAARDLLEGGWHDRARERCQQSLRLDPDNRDAAQLLNKINAAATAPID